MATIRRRCRRASSKTGICRGPAATMRIDLLLMRGFSWGRASACAPVSTDEVPRKLKPAPHGVKPQTLSIGRIRGRRIALSVSEGTLLPEPRPLADAQGYPEY